MGQPQGFQQQPHQQQQPGFGFNNAPSFQSPPGSHGSSSGAQPRMLHHPQPHQPDFINQISTWDQLCVL